MMTILWHIVGGFNSVCSYRFVQCASHNLPKISAKNTSSLIYFMDEEEKKQCMSITWEMDSWKSSYNFYLTKADFLCSSFHIDAIDMLSFPILKGFGKLCGTGKKRKLVSKQMKHKRSIQNMSLIEEGHITEVKRTKKQLPYLKPDGYYLYEWLFEQLESSGKSGTWFYYKFGGTNLFGNQ